MGLVTKERRGREQLVHTDLAAVDGCDRVSTPTSLQFTDGFANDDGTPNEEMRVINVDVPLSEREGGTRRGIR